MATKHPCPHDDNVRVTSACEWPQSIHPADMDRTHLSHGLSSCRRGCSGHSHALVIIVRTWMLWPLACTGHTDVIIARRWMLWPLARTGHTDAIIVRTWTVALWPKASMSASSFQPKQARVVKKAAVAKKPAACLSPKGRNIRVVGGDNQCESQIAVGKTNYVGALGRMASRNAHTTLLSARRLLRKPG